MVQFKKHTSGVYVIETEQELENDSACTVTTRHGKEVDCLIWKLVSSKNGKNYYSYTRKDGFCRKEKHLNNAEKYLSAAEKSIDKAGHFYEKSNEHSAFLSLGEPIKVGHHSEKRHRAIIDKAWRNVGKSVEYSKKSQEQNERSKGALRAAQNNIFIDTPDCLERLNEKMSLLEEQRQKVKEFNKEANKTGQNPLGSHVLTNLGAKIRETKKKLSIAEKLWERD